MKLHGFHGNPSCDFKEWGCFFKDTHSSAATLHIVINLISTLSKDIALILACWNSKISNMNIHELKKKHLKGMKNTLISQ